MSKRRKISVKSINDVSVLGQISKDDLLADNEYFDKDNYNPLIQNEEKVILIPEHRTEVITIRLTSQENEKLRNIAQQNGLSKSALIRLLVTRSLKKSDFL